MKLDKFVTRTRMVLYSFEKSLGEYVISKNCIENLSEQLIHQIESREEKAGKQFDATKICDIVAASHFNEIIDLAVQSASNTSDEELLSKIRKQASDISLANIRNTLSHANRDFKIQYWYLSAAIASMPEVESLGLVSLIESLISAENDELKEPPKEWLVEASNEILNNLPVSFEHDATGLVGRTQEAKTLTKLILNKRVATIAVVAPGGVGKTALVLDLLHNLSFTPEIAKNFSGIVFVSLKTEELTPQGIRSLTAIESLSELKEELLYIFNDLWEMNFDTFEELIGNENEYKPLVFIDNLETLIRDSETEFNDFCEELPYDWKVLITSRINVANSKTLPLSTLSEPAAAQLAREYLKDKGSLPLSNNEILEVINNCKFNPLAIKLTLDYWSLGNTLPTSWSKANAGIAEFSFKNLIESLSAVSVEVLELLFTVNRCTRREVCNLLTINIDESAKAISELSKTSLIKRVTEDDVEYYEINASIREFLLLNPKNISVRQKVQTNIRTNKDRALEITRKQNAKNVSVNDENFIPENVDETLKISIFKANKLCVKYHKGVPENSFEEVTNIYNELNELSAVYSSDYLYHRCLARVLTLMHDNLNAREALYKSRKMNPNDIPTLILLAKSYHDSRDYNKSEEIYVELTSKIELRKEARIWQTILNGYYLCLLHQSKYEDIFESTKKWRDDSEYGSTLGTYRASAFKRKIESQIENKETIELYKSFNSALKIMHTVFRDAGYFHVATREACKIIDSISHYFFSMRSEYTNEQLLSANQLLAFCEEHIKDIYQKQGKDASELFKFVQSARNIPIKENPFKRSKWDIRKSPSEEVGVRYEEIDGYKDFIRTRVQNIPQDRSLKKPFIFTEDAYNKRYFVHKSSFKNGENCHFYNLEVGDVVAIKPKLLPNRQLEQSDETYYIR
ncbi:hypothetical protein V6457_001739 [Vibrio vulnificus]|nr:hypothetical protein [Vibrio vulnificus]ELV8743073.1 hypothetical protein [Vibrio vulnificus]